MDEISSFNQSSWDELVRRGVMYARPFLNLTPETARQFLDPDGTLLGDVTGLDVLCLASAGGQQSACFGVLGARVTVIDLSNGMLEGDRKVAEHYGFAIDIHQGDMRDLSRFAGGSFDIVWQPYSINFVPDPRPVWREVARVLRPGGHYCVQIHNPFLQGMSEEEWDGKGYPLNLHYIDGAEIPEPDWSFYDDQGVLQQLRGPRAFRHSLGTLVNELSSLGFLILRLSEWIGEDPEADPGSWDHFIRVAPPYLTAWATYRPDLLPAISPKAGR
jgi:SAM-dependent methyltransferase